MFRQPQCQDEFETWKSFEKDFLEGTLAGDAPRPDLKNSRL